ncbi:MAG: class I SAM-dependent methyltransferase [Actinobacteria bacterium]|nr:class I SAM-dependent methyltransferase [Actinomycetota bacterium]
MTITDATTDPTVPVQPDLTALKARQQKTWSAGDYAVIGATLQIVGEQLCESADLRAGSQVLDVATGNGGTAIAAARRFCEVTGSDYVPELVERARERARAERFAITFEVGDAEDLPYADASFDSVLSTFGVMFVADHPRAANELLRVCRPGGTIAFANWSPTGFIGRMFKTIGAHVPPPAAVSSPLLWGTEAYVRDLFGSGVDDVVATPRHFVFRYRSADHMLDTFRSFYGPMVKAFEALDDAGRVALEADLRRLFAEATTSAEQLVIASEYLEVVATRATAA